MGVGKFKVFVINDLENGSNFNGYITSNSQMYCILR